MWRMRYVRLLLLLLELRMSLGLHLLAHYHELLLLLHVRLHHHLLLSFLLLLMHVKVRCADECPLVLLRNVHLWVLLGGSLNHLLLLWLRCKGRLHMATVVHHRWGLHGHLLLVLVHLRRRVVLGHIDHLLMRLPSRTT
jgi:hypothetical protein